MPRIRQNEEADTMRDLVGEINAQRARFGYSTLTEFGKRIGVCQKSAWNYLDDPRKIQLGTLRTIVKEIRPNPGIVLKALGYSSQDIKKLAREYAP